MSQGLKTRNHLHVVPPASGSTLVTYTKWERRLEIIFIQIAVAALLCWVLWT